jgi:hypothetical protein
MGQFAGSGQEHLSVTVWEALTGADRRVPPAKQGPESGMRVSLPVVHCFPQKNWAERLQGNERVAGRF